MRALIRFITKTPAGGTEHHDRHFDVPVITIGRATDQVLHLRDRRVRLEHATIEARADGMHVVSSAMTGVVVNGRSQRDARLAAGDVIEIGANVLKVIDAPDGVDLALTFELSAGASADHFEASWSAPVSGIGGFGKRTLSWLLATAVLLVAVVLPGAGLFGTASTDRLWLAGPVHSVHASVADDCGACHVRPFERVPDAVCAECHSAAPHVASPDLAVLGEVRCAACHLEHNEPPQLVNRHQALCAGCHADPPGGSGLEPAADFLDAHPEFKVSLLRPATDGAGDTEWRVEHLLMSAAAGADDSNLRFDHATHLDPAGIVAPDGRRVIDCAECHRPEPGGAGFEPIVMDEHCSGCHTLSFDPDFPSRTVPHGDPAAVVQALVEYYSARLLGADPDAAEQRVRRPGRALTRADRDRAAAEARVQALKVAGDLFERRACATCHTVTALDAGAAVPWRVEPVRLTERFFVHANFTHAAHRTEVTACDACHAASESAAATDVLIPGIDSCRECHGSGYARRNSSAQTPSTCILCHGFHFEHKGRIQ